VNRAINAAATEQAAVGGIDDDVDDLFGQVADEQADVVITIRVCGGGHGGCAEFSAS